MYNNNNMFDIIGEFVGTFLVLYVALHFSTNAASGLALGTMVYIIGYLTERSFNPFVTIAKYTSNLISYTNCVKYLIAELLAFLLIIRYRSLIVK